jgi:hypothetical protein
MMPSLLINREPPTSKLFYTAADKIRDARDGEKGGISESFSFQGFEYPLERRSQT